MLRIMTYNIRTGLGLDRVRSLERVARVIREARPTIVALQEVDFARPRSGAVDQAAALADLLDMHHLAAPSLRTDSGSYGNAILSREPLERVRHEVLPHMPGTEPRSAMWVRVIHDGVRVEIINTHLSFRRVDRPLQIAELLGPHWLAHEDAGPHTILCGDLNCSPRDAGFRRLTDLLMDAQRVTPGRARTTWPTRRPFRRIDHILASPAVTIEEARVVRARPARVASDHFPVVADVSF